MIYNSCKYYYLFGIAKPWHGSINLLSIYENDVIYVLAFEFGQIPLCS